MLRTASLAGAVALIMTASPLGVREAADAQVVARVARVGLLVGGTNDLDRVFVDRLRELGWVEGRNVIIEIRRAEGRSEVLSTLAADLVNRRVDVIVTSGTTSIRAARQATDTIPIVMAGAGDPVASGFVKSLARPGGNITGVSLLGHEIVPKTLSLLHEAVPRAKRIDLLANAANPANEFFGRVTVDAAQALGIESRLIEIRKPDDLESAIAATPAHALFALPDPMFGLHAKRLADAAIRRRLPLATFGRLYVEAGSFMSYAVNFDEVFRTAANYTDRILRGGNPAELPVEQPRQYELIFNQKTARTLRLTIPQPLLHRADRIIE